MKITDLMVGDLVKTNPSCGKLANNIKSTIGIVSEIGYLPSDGYYIIIAGHKEKYYDDEVEPIQMTDEILDKNGFKKNNFNRYVLGESNLMEEIYYELGWIQLRYPNSYYCISTCEYVHEFQHSLKMFKIEKEIVI